MQAVREGVPAAHRAAGLFPPHLAGTPGVASYTGDNFDDEGAETRPPTPRDLDLPRVRVQYLEAVEDDQYWAQGLPVVEFYARAMTRAPQTLAQYPKAVGALLKEVGGNLEECHWLLAFFAAVARDQKRETVREWWRQIVSTSMRPQMELMVALGSVLHMTATRATDDVLQDLEAMLPPDSDAVRALEQCRGCDRVPLSQLPLPILDDSLLREEWEEPGSYEWTPYLWSLKQTRHKQAENEGLDEEEAIKPWRVFTSIQLNDAMWAHFFATGDTTYLRTPLAMALLWEEFYGCIEMGAILTNADMEEEPPEPYISHPDEWKPFSEREPMEKDRYFCARLALARFQTWGHHYDQVLALVEEEMEREWRPTLQELAGTIKRNRKLEDFAM